MNSGFGSRDVWDVAAVVVMGAVGVAGWAADYPAVALPAAALAGSAALRLGYRRMRR